MQKLVTPHLWVAVALLSGCAAAPSKDRYANPFDESSTVPARSIQSERPAAPTTVRQEHISVRQPDPESVSSAVATPVVDEAFNPQSPQIPISSTPLPGSGAEAFAEALKVGATGDAATKAEMLEQSAFQGNLDALYELARMYQNGSGVPKDMQMAIAYLTTADGLGHAESARVLGWNYILGNGVPVDPVYGAGLMEKSMASSLRAKREYALLLTNTLKPGLNNPTKGKALLRELFDAGDTEGTTEYIKFLAVQGDVLGAEKVRTEAAARGVKIPSGNLPGVSAGPIVIGDGALPRRTAPTSDQKAEAVKLKALQGDLPSVYNYANQVLLGKFPSVESDFEAYCWFSVASSRGYTQATMELQSIAGVRTIADKRTPGRLDACIADINSVIAQ